MNRGQRRETTKRKWLSRARKIYYSSKHWYFSKFESITDFLDSFKWLKKTTVAKSEYHKKPKRQREYDIE